MKSLEIVNERINKLKGNPELKYWKGNKIDCLFHNEEGAGLLTCSQLETIKADLEVLDIIRKKDVNLATLKLCIMRTDTIEQLLSKYNKSRYFTQDELTMEELLKLKQWLEENEYGNE